MRKESKGKARMMTGAAHWEIAFVMTMAIRVRTKSVLLTTSKMGVHKSKTVVSKRTLHVLTWVSSTVGVIVIIHDTLLPHFTQPFFFNTKIKINKKIGTKKSGGTGRGVRVRECIFPFDF